MATVSFVNKTCSLCGKSGRQAEMGLRGMDEPGDLDTRPSAAHRSSVYMLVQRCHSCGYCAPDISQGSSKAKSIVASDEYRAKLENKELPEPVNSLVCWSTIQQAFKKFSDAGWAMLYAAWICDDDTHVKQHSRSFRQHAFEFFKKAQENREKFATSPVEEELIKVDILRRGGQFSLGKELCVAQIAKKHPGKMNALFVYEEELLDGNDTAPHTIRDALEDID